MNKNLDTFMNIRKFHADSNGTSLRSVAYAILRLQFYKYNWSGGAILSKERHVIIEITQ